MKNKSDKVKISAILKNDAYVLPVAFNFRLSKRHWDYILRTTLYSLGRHQIHQLLAPNFKKAPHYSVEIVALKNFLRIKNVVSVDFCKFFHSEMSLVFNQNPTHETVVKLINYLTSANTNHYVAPFPVTRMTPGFKSRLVLFVSIQLPWIELYDPCYVKALEDYNKPSANAIVFSLQEEKMIASLKKKGYQVTKIPDNGNDYSE